ncbi:MAG: glycosyltransferase [Gallionella sp.]|nr:glycosyltransferase [Gallionella sp.]
MKISIAVPSYNYARFLDACLNSILMQDYGNFEVLIADGGSDDGSLEIIDRFCAQDKRFGLVSTSDQGQADAVKKAFDHATGDILCFLNADDCYLCVDALRGVVDAFNAYPSIDVLSMGGYYLNADGRWMRPVKYRYHPLDGFHLMRYRTAVLQPATFWRGEVYENIGWPTQFHFVFDVVFFYAAYQKYSWLELDKPVAGYRMHGENKSSLVRPVRIKELAQFEEIKFGPNSFRALYLSGIGAVAQTLEKFGSVGSLLKRVLYQLVNTLAFVSAYRLPGI